MWDNKSILITGGTGSFGRAFVRTVLERFPLVRRLVVFSRHELKQFEMAQVYSPSKYPSLRYFIWASPNFPDTTLRLSSPAVQTPLD